jgi:hypothetical protein
MCEMILLYFGKYTACKVSADTHHVEQIVIHIYFCKGSQPTDSQNRTTQPQSRRIFLPLFYSIYLIKLIYQVTYFCSKSELWIMTTNKHITHISGTEILMKKWTLKLRNQKWCKVLKINTTVPNIQISLLRYVYKIEGNRQKESTVYKTRKKI